MAKQAKTLDSKRIKQAMGILHTSHQRVMFLLSAKAGLRAKEVAGLQWQHVDLDGRSLELVETKGGKRRRVPIAEDLYVQILEHRNANPERQYVLTNQHSRPGQPLTANAVAQFLRDLYTRKLGWTGYSSHSGRRTAVTNWARKVHAAGGSIRDVQQMAGHSDLATTSKYIDTDPQAQAKLVDL